MSNKKRINEMDLHIQYVMETGKHFQYKNSTVDTESYHSKQGYSREYSLWLEEQLINLTNKQ